MRTNLNNTSYAKFQEGKFQEAFLGFRTSNQDFKYLKAAAFKEGVTLSMYVRKLVSDTINKAK